MTTKGVKIARKTIFRVDAAFSSKNINFVSAELETALQFNLKRHNNVQKR